MKILFLYFVAIAIAMLSYAGDFILLKPTGALGQHYKEEKSQVTNIVNQLIGRHNQRRKLLQRMAYEIPDLSLVWYEPIFHYCEFASVFWGTNEIAVVTDEASNIKVETYSLTEEAKICREKLVALLAKYDFICPLGGDHNVALMGVVFGDADSALKCFSIQIGSAFKQAKGKLFCGTYEGVLAYRYVSDLREWLLQQRMAQNREGG